MVETSALSIHLAIDRQPLSVTPQTPVSEAIVLMSQARSSCAIVVNHNKPLGIFTERDVVKLTAAQTPEDAEPLFDRGCRQQPIAGVMSQNLFTLPESQLPDLTGVLELLRQHHIRHLPIVDSQGNLVGTITHQSIRNTIEPADWMRLRRVREVMNAQVITAPGEVSVLEVAKLMMKHRVSCVAIASRANKQLPGCDPDRSIPDPEGQNHQIPVGIVTERDILQFQALGLNPQQLVASQVMSSPLLLVQPTDSLWKAHQLMRQHRVRRLMVADGEKHLHGIVTQTSLLQGCAPLDIDAAIAALQQLVEERTSELQQANELLRKEVRDRQQTEAALRLSEARLAGILDSADDAIISIDDTQQIQLFNQGAEKIFGYSATEAIGQSIDLLLPERLRQMHRTHIENFRQSPDLSRRMGSPTHVLGQRKDGSTFPAEASISKLEVGSEKLLTVILRDITTRVEAQAALQLQLERERLMATMRDRIRASLNLTEILNTTVAEVRQFLQTDRVIVYRFQPDWSGKVEVESVAAPTVPILGRTIFDPCFGESYAELYKQGRIKATADIYAANLNQCHLNLLRQIQVRANLVVPILLNDELRIKHEEGFDPFLMDRNRLWGLLIAHHCQETRQWQPWETEFLKGLATQVAIAIQQSTLFEQLQGANQQLHRLASLDGLTQVANRRCFNEFLEREWQRLAREGAPLSLILCDLDYFKPYNDTYGHQAGDECLQQVAAAIRECAKPPAELVARYGGEEFAAILSKADVETAIAIAQKIRDRVAELRIPHVNSKVSHFVTLSLGVASTIPYDTTSPNGLIAAADRALYQAKARGRDRVEFARSRRS